jgi:predicted MFS family arabinose efflux permease
LILAIIGDVIPEQRRGAAMGLVMSSFSVASICGVPLGLILANSLNWHLPFFVLAGLSYVVLAASAWILPPLRGHMLHLKDQHPVARMMAVLSHGDHQMAFLFMALLSVTGFIIFPNIANYMVCNVGLTEKQLPLIYLAGGLATVFSMNWIGRWADRSGKLRVFTLMSLMATIPILLVTNLPRASVVVAVATSTLLMVCMSGRMVPAMALMTASIEPQYRGGFMSINSAVQQFSCGVAAYVSGQVLTQTATGELAHFPVLGIGSIVCALICIYLARFLKMPEGSQPAMQGLPAEG